MYWCRGWSFNRISFGAKLIMAFLFLAAIGICDSWKSGLSLCFFMAAVISASLIRCEKGRFRDSLSSCWKSMLVPVSLLVLCIIYFPSIDVPGPTHYVKPENLKGVMPKVVTLGHFEGIKIFCVGDYMYMRGSTQNVIQMFDDNGPIHCPKIQIEEVPRLLVD